MTFLCLWSPSWRNELAIAMQAPLLEVVPRIVADGEVVWADVRGLPILESLEKIRHLVTQHGNSRVKIGIADTPIAAEVGARYAPTRITHVRSGGDKTFLAPFPVSVLHPDVICANLFDGAGIELCQDLSALTRESVEVRFGAEGARLWRLAHADDVRRIFTVMPQNLPVSSFEWTDYTIRRAERLVFVVNALCGNVCTMLRERGTGAIGMTIRFALANRTVYEHSLRAARPTASQTAWMRLLRQAIEQVVLPDAVVGLTLRVDTLAGLGGKQGDLFDRGFTTAQAAEEAIAQLLDDQGSIVVDPENNAHPLIDRRTEWTAVSVSKALDYTSVPSMQPELTLQLLAMPLHIWVVTKKRRDQNVPASYRDATRTYTIVEAAGPDRVSGETWGDQYAREYFRCVNDAGTLVWLYRDARTDTWYLQGWWD